MSHSDKFRVELLIGCDHYFEIVTSNKFDVFETLNLIPTKVGSIVCGPYKFDNFSSNLISNYSTNFVSNINSVDIACEHMTRSELGIKPSEDIEKNLVLSKIFAIEHLITNKEMQLRDNEIMTRIFESEIYFDEIEQQYAVPLLFKGGFPPKNLPSNYELTVKRNNSLKHQIDQPKKIKLAQIWQHFA